MYADREHCAGDGHIPEPLNAEDARATVRAAAAGDRHALGRLMAAYGGRLQAYAYRMTGDAAAAEEITHDVFLSLLRSSDSLRHDSRLSTWLYRVVVNRCRDWLRRETRELAPPVAGTDTYADPSPGPEAAVQNEQASRHLAAAVGKLPAEYREAITLRFAAGLQYHEIAAVLGCPPGSVASRIHRALERLGAILSEQGLTRESL